MGDNKNQQQEPDINQLRKVRREKLADLQAAGKDPFVITKYDVTYHTTQCAEEYNKLETELLAGRTPVDVSDLPEEEARPLKKKDYEERREIMDAKPIEVSVAGRLMSKRVMGKAAFANIQDKLGNVQLYVSREGIGEDSYADFKKYDIGDIVGVKGFVFRTMTGEISIHAHEVTLLTKSLQILPEKFHGLKDVDMRYTALR